MTGRPVAGSAELDPAVVGGTQGKCVGARRRRRGQNETVGLEGGRFNAESINFNAESRALLYGLTQFGQPPRGVTPVFGDNRRRADFIEADRKP